MYSKINKHEVNEHYETFGALCIAYFKYIEQFHSGIDMEKVAAAAALEEILSTEPGIRDALLLDLAERYDPNYKYVAE